MISAEDKSQQKTVCNEEQQKTVDENASIVDRFNLITLLPLYSTRVIKFCRRFLGASCCDVVSAGGTPARFNILQTPLSQSRRPPVLKGKCPHPAVPRSMVGLRGMPEINDSVDDAGFSA